MILNAPLRSGLYVHFPFCVHKCGYCDFNSWGETARAPQERWLASLDRQAAYWGERLTHVSFETIFFGGGTPSLLENDLLVQAGETIRRRLRVDAAAEWTMECNPETVDVAKLEALRAAGANRLSVGIQSFRDGHLELLERRARRRDNLRALETIAAHWTGRWSLDLMFGLPRQSSDEWRADLGTALDFAPDHISAYQLTLTTARSRHWEQPAEDELLAMFDETEARLDACGLRKYETSNFARPGHESRHNVRYWKLQTFLGLGPGASGLLSGAMLGEQTHANSTRLGSHQKNPDRFEIWGEKAGNPQLEPTWLTPRDVTSHLEEMLMMGLRLKEGLPATRLGRFHEVLKESLSIVQINELIEERAGVWYATPKGSQQLDTLLQLLFRKIEKVPPGFLDLAGIDPTFA